MGKRNLIKPYTVKRLLQHGRQAHQWVHRQRASGASPDGRRQSTKIVSSIGGTSS